MNDRNGRSGVNDHERWSGARRKPLHHRLGGGGRLRQRRRDIGSRMKKELDDGHAGKGLRLQVLDIVDHGRRAAFDGRGDAPLHLERREPRIGPGDGHHGDVDFRENVRGRAHQHERGDQNNGKRQHHEGVWPA